jgi:hypothetical protein
MTFGTNEAERMKIASGGAVSINSSQQGYGLFTTSRLTIGNGTSGDGICIGGLLENQSAYTVQADTNTGSRFFAYIANGNQSPVGTISFTSSATAFNTTSDYRLKEDLQDFKGLEMVSKIPVYDYKWKAEDSRSYGVMAHELAEVLPDAVTGDKDAKEMQGVDYSKIVPLLVKSIQELSAKLEALECQCEKK